MSTKPMKIIAVRSQNAPTVVKKPVPEYDPADIDLVVNMVSREYRTREKERKIQAERTRLRVIKQREEAVTRRENEMHRWEERQRMLNMVANAVLNTILVAFSVLGMATALWFWWTL